MAAEHSGASAPSIGAGRIAAVRRALALVLAGTLAGACSETPLNVAPVVDRSVPAGTAAAAVRAASSNYQPVVGASSGAVAGAPLYTVQKGDTLFHVASGIHVSVQELARWNGIDPGTPIFVGQQLRLAPPGEASAAPTGAAAPAGEDTSAAQEAVATPVPLAGDSTMETRPLESRALAPVAQAPAPADAGGAMPAGASSAAAPVGVASAPAVVPAPATAQAPQAGAGAGAAPAASAPAHEPAWIWPAGGAVTVHFDLLHSKEIQIAVTDDTPVQAVADGTVSYTGNPREYGNLVVVRHGEDLLSVYAHLKTILVKEGQAVHQGQPLATAGKTPGSTSLHFGVRRNGVAVDPMGLLPPR